MAFVSQKERKREREDGGGGRAAGRRRRQDLEMEGLSAALRIQVEDPEGRDLTEITKQDSGELQLGTQASLPCDPVHPATASCP